MKNKDESPTSSVSSTSSPNPGITDQTSPSPKLLLTLSGTPPLISTSAIIIIKTIIIIIVITFSKSADRTSPCPRSGEGEGGGRAIEEEWGNNGSKKSKKSTRSEREKRRRYRSGLSRVAPVNARKHTGGSNAALVRSKPAKTDLREHKSKSTGQHKELRASIDTHRNACAQTLCFHSHLNGVGRF